jgi:hypothetical protein
MIHRNDSPNAVIQPPAIDIMLKLFKQDWMRLKRDYFTVPSGPDRHDTRHVTDIGAYIHNKLARID